MSESALNIVMGIDPGLASLGWGIVSHDTNEGADNLNYISHGVITTAPSSDLAYRLLTLDEEFDTIMRRYAVLELAYEYQYFVKNVTSGLPVAHALGIILLYCAKHRVSVTHYSPLDVKKQITGNARASKDMVNKYVCLPLRIDEIHPNHAADALAVAVTHILKSQSKAILKNAKRTQNTASLQQKNMRKASK